MRVCASVCVCACVRVYLNVCVCVGEWVRVYVCFGARGGGGCQVLYTSKQNVIHACIQNDFLRTAN